MKRCSGLKLMPEVSNVYKKFLRMKARPQRGSNSACIVMHVSNIYGQSAPAWNYPIIFPCKYSPVNIPCKNVRSTYNGGGCKIKTFFIGKLIFGSNLFF